MLCASSSKTDSRLVFSIISAIFPIFQNVEVVQKIVDIDNQWRKEQFVLERTKFVKNLCSKTIGKKMKAKEPKGDTADLEEGA